MNNTESIEVRQMEEVQELLSNMKEQKSLKKFDSEKYKDSKIGWVIQHKRTGRIVEIKAPSAEIASVMIGWRLRHLIVLEKKEYI